MRGCQATRWHQLAYLMLRLSAAGEWQKCEAVDAAGLAKKRKRTMIDRDCQGLVLRSPRVHECEAQVEHDAVLEAGAGDVAEFAQRRPRRQRFQVCDCAKKNKAGRERKLNVAHLTLLSQVCNNLASLVALTSRTYQMIFAVELKKQGR